MKKPVVMPTKKVVPNIKRSEEKSKEVADKPVAKEPEAAPAPVVEKKKLEKTTPAEDKPSTPAAPIAEPTT